MLSVIYTTVGNRDDAVKLSKYLIENKFAACVNLLNAISSYYIWDGKLQEDQECALLIKTDSSILTAVIKEIKKAHPYATPCIYEISSSENCDEDFSKWVKNQIS